MNEIRDLIVGIDFGKDFTQMCYFDRKAEEPRHVSMKVGTSIYEAPTRLTRKSEDGEFVVGIEAEYFAREKAGLAVGGFYDLCGTEEAVTVGRDQLEPWELVQLFLEGMLKFLGVMDVVKNTSCLTITCPSFDAIRIRNLKRACKALGFSDKRFLLMDYEESFYYYGMTQQREALLRNVGWFDFGKNQVSFRKLILNRQPRPITVILTEAVSAELSENPEERDQNLVDFFEKYLDRKEVFGSIQLTGEGFSTDWAKQSVKVLMQQHRKAYHGKNLYAEGACRAGKERMENHFLKNYRFLSNSLIQKDIGMELRVMGSPAYWPLIEGGNNWYECQNRFEILLDGAKDLIFIVSTLGEKEKKRISMPLPELPERPAKTTRLEISLEYISPEKCSIEVRDLGFGDLFPSSGKVWQELIEW